MMLLQRAADKKHIPAIYLLGIYHRYNQTFYSSEYSDNLENIDKAIYYYTKAARMIEDLPDYPKGATSDIARIEHTEHMSYHLFTGVPFLYFRGYFITFNVIMNDRILYDSIYTDTLEILYKMKNSAKQCLDRSALNVWQEERSMLHAFQQLKCNVFLKFAEKAYPLEKQRIEVAKSCQGPVNRCYEHQEVVNKINELAKEMFQQIMSVPKVEKLIRFKKK